MINSTNRAGLRTAGFAAILLGAPATAFAGTVQTQMGVSATVSANCTITVGGVDFSAINPQSGTAHTANGSVTVTCTNGAPWSIGADAGGGTSATMTNRRMMSGANFINYSLFTDSGYANVWGSGATGTVQLTGTGTGSAQAYTIYGRVPAGQTTIRAGTYGDTINVTVTY
jgi:spore coat protein U-like protein